MRLKIETCVLDIASFVYVNSPLCAFYAES